MAEYIKAHIGSAWRGIPITYFENSRYLETNNIVSLYKAAAFCDDEMLLLECDAHIVEVPEEMWCEIDDAEDLARASKRFEQQES